MNLHFLLLLWQGRLKHFFRGFKSLYSKYSKNDSEYTQNHAFWGEDQIFWDSFEKNQQEHFIQIIILIYSWSPVKVKTSKSKVLTLRRRKLLREPMKPSKAELTLSWTTGSARLVSPTKKRTLCTLRTSWRGNLSFLIFMLIHQVRNSWRIFFHFQIGCKDGGAKVWPSRNLQDEYQQSNEGHPEQVQGPPVLHWRVHGLRWHHWNLGVPRHRWRLYPSFYVLQARSGRREVLMDLRYLQIQWKIL